MATQPTQVSPSAYAKKYGTVDTTYSIQDAPPLVGQLAAAKRSGLIPILPRSIMPEGPLGPRYPSGTPNPAATTLDADIESSQRRIFAGFTSRNLYDAGTLPDENSKRLGPESLKNGIVPMLQFDNVWESVSRRPLRRGFIPIVANGPGYSLPPNSEWRADESVIHTILTPVLRLASRILLEPCTTTFIEHLVTDDFRKLPPEKYAPKTPIDQVRYSFHAQPSKDQRISMQQEFQAMSNFTQEILVIEFSHPNYSCFGPNRTEPPGSDGLTYGEGVKVYVHLHIRAYQTL